MRGFSAAAVLLVLAVAAACGSRTGTEDDFFDATLGPLPQPETCNGLDDDLDASVDEDFRDEVGRYVHVEHCGGCGALCEPRDPNELEVGCGLVAETPVCVALTCAAGFAPSLSGRCVPAWDFLCLACAGDGDCGDILGATCATVGGEARCAIPCALSCPTGYACSADDVCAPEGGSCSCDPGETFDLACGLVDPAGLRCVGSARCTDGVLSECLAPDEVCDETDQDCDGLVDEGFRDARGAYSLDIHHCGACGIDCTLDVIPEGDLICGGDPFAPTCVLDCPDARDGIMPGDRIDADRDIATGCECTVSSLTDVPGPVLAEGEALDVNCDGADGIVLESFYVATDGDDTGPGSPTRPLLTIGEALRRASESIGMPEPRPHVFVASGTYTETIDLPDGVALHGGYRRDFLALDPSGFQVIVRAPADTTAPGGAAMISRGAGATETVARWITLRGRDAIMASSPAFGAVLVDPGAQLTLREMEVRAGVGGAGRNGASGGAGGLPSAAAMTGAPPRGAVESAARECTPGMTNVVRGGSGGRSDCDGASVNGGNGGSPSCPVFASFQPSGDRGQNAGAGAPGGTGGVGGQDSQGPIMGSGCPVAICCGLADFTVPGDFMGPQAGSPGSDGSPGTAGRGCVEPLGSFDGETWREARATAGTAGSAGSGGGGGGGGGGAAIDWFDGICEFADGLGGGGGGGGGGGCGGGEGRPGTSGAPSIAIVVRTTFGAPVPAVTDVVVAPSNGGRGGDGGAGGDGAPGGAGAFGGELPREDRSTPTLAGPFPGARGGAGGDGGPGGGAGGGCGGGSVGIWLSGVGTTEPPGVAAWRSGNTFRLGSPGMGGSGGGGAAAASDGAEGGAVNVVVR